MYNRDSNDNQPIPGITESFLIRKTFFTKSRSSSNSFLWVISGVFGIFFGILFTKNALQSVLQGISAERTRFELVVRNDPYVGLANRWFQPLTHLSGSHLAKLRHKGGLQSYEYFRKNKYRGAKRPIFAPRSGKMPDEGANTPVSAPRSEIQGLTRNSRSVSPAILSVLWHLVARREAISPHGA